MKLWMENREINDSSSQGYSFQRKEEKSRRRDAKDDKNIEMKMRDHRDKKHRSVVYRRLEGSLDILKDWNQELETMNNNTSYLL